MKKFKEFIKKKQLDNKFKKLGGGYQLGEEQSPNSARSTAAGRSQGPSSSGGVDNRWQQQQTVRRPDVDIIASAAERRFKKLEGKDDSEAGLTPMQKMVKMKAKKELEEERLKMERQMDDLSTGNDEKKSAEEFIPSVLYTCEIFDDDLALPKSEMMDAIKSMLYELMPEDPIGSSVWLIHTFNQEQPKLTAISTIQKYLQNIIDNPNEKKYLQIKTSNKIFVERLTPIVGSLEYLRAVGFKREVREDNNSMEEYFIMTSPPDTRRIAENLGTLLDGKPISIRVFRDIKVFAIDPEKSLPSPHIPHDFFRRTAEEIRREQQQKTEALEKMETLRTQRTRELDSRKKELGTNPYKYCYIRIRFPNNFVLQGTFNVYEKFAAIREFVFQHLSIKHGTFSLSLAGNSNNKLQCLKEEENNLLDYGLAPSALIHFYWDSETLTFFSQQGQPISYLRSELEEAAQPL